MTKEIIAELLEKDLKKISDEDFNDKIIQQLSLQRKKQKQNLFESKTLIQIFIGICLFIIGLSMELFNNFSLSTIIVGMAISIIPLFFIVFNKIYQSTLLKSKHHENFI